jgi:hypothetical protein
MPPAVMTNVIPRLITPMTVARRRMVSALSTSRKRSPDVTAPTTTISSRAMTRPRLRPTPPLRKRRTGLTGAAAAGFTVAGAGVGVCSLTRRLLP